MSYRCVNCPVSMVPSDDDSDHPYDFDGKVKVRLIGLKRYVCRTCRYSQIEIPKLEPLHRVIAQAIKGLRVPRAQLGFLFTPGPLGVSDGEWGVAIGTSSTTMPE